MELVMKNNMVHVEMIKAPEVTDGGIDLSAASETLERVKNNLPFKVLTVEEGNPMGLQSGDFVYIRPGSQFYKMLLEHTETCFINLFDVIAVTKSFDYEKHTATVSVRTNIIQ